MEELFVQAIIRASAYVVGEIWCTLEGAAGVSATAPEAVRVIPRTVSWTVMDVT
jgi:hypothetical protein